MSSSPGVWIATSVGAGICNRTAILSRLDAVDNSPLTTRPCQIGERPKVDDAIAVDYLRWSSQ